MSIESLITVAVCDDQPQALEKTSSLTESILAEVPHRIDAYHDPNELLEQLDEKKYTLAILDIQMPAYHTDGIEVGKKLLACCPDCRIIFQTSYLAYAQDVYDVEHVAFVLKQDMEKNLGRAIDRLLKALRRSDAPRVPVEEGGVVHMIAPEQVVYIERNLRTTKVHIIPSGKEAERIIVTREKTEELLARLNEALRSHGYERDCLVQTHKSYAVHWRYVRRYEKDRLILDDGVKSVVPISRRYADHVRRFFVAWTM